MFQPRRPDLCALLGGRSAERQVAPRNRLIRAPRHSPPPNELCQYTPHGFAPDLPSRAASHQVGKDGARRHVKALVREMAAESVTCSAGVPAEHRGKRHAAPIGRTPREARVFCWCFRSRAAVERFLCSRPAFKVKRSGCNLNAAEGRAVPVVTRLLQDVGRHVARAAPIPMIASYRV